MRKEEKERKLKSASTVQLFDYDATTFDSLLTTLQHNSLSDSTTPQAEQRDPVGRKIFLFWGQK